jgi:hypothetical protein
MLIIVSNRPRRPWLGRYFEKSQEEPAPNRPTHASPLEILVGLGVQLARARFTHIVLAPQTLA